MSPNENVRLYAKLEFINPTGSVKDRVAKYLMEDLERRGVLHTDSVIVGPTSGNTGIALAIIARRKGYRVAVVMPDDVTTERRQLLALFGAEISTPRARRVPTARGAGQVPRFARRRCVMPYRCGNPENRWPITRARPRRSSPTAPKWTCSSPASAPAGPSPGWDAGSASTTRRCGSSPPSRCPARTSRACGRSRRASCPRCSTPRSSTRKYLVSNTDAIEALGLRRTQGCSRGSPGCGAGGGGSRGAGYGARHDRGPARRRRLEVPLGRHLDARSG